MRVFFRAMKKYKFKAKIEAGRGGGAFVLFPYDTEKEFATKGNGKNIGDAIEVVVWKDEDVRTLEVPAVFQKLMKQEGLLAFFEQLSYTHRKEYCRWITEAKKEETRAARLEKSIVMLRKGIKTPG
jgi:hypothetical protein